MPEKLRHKPTASQAHKRRIDDALMIGIEDEIDACHQLSAKQRSMEIAFFATLYSIGACACLLLPKDNYLHLIGIIPMGLALNALGILIHEGLHGILAKSPRINHLLSFLCGVPLLISASAYQATHTDHHFDFGRKKDYGTYRQHLDNRHLVWLAYYAQLFFGSILYILLIPLLAWRSSKLKTRLFILGEYLLIGILVWSFATLLSWENVLLLWLYPSVISMALTNIRGLASHALGDQEDIYLSSRTVDATPLVERLFIYENYHLEHHLFPQVPSYNLKRVHQLVWDRLPRALYAKSYLSFLIAFFKASCSLNLACCGLISPKIKEEQA